MKVHSIPIDQISIPDNRQRREFNHESITELAGSIAQNGLISPVVVRRGGHGIFRLVAGERRLRALTYLWNFGESLRCGTQEFPENHVPAIDIGELDDVDAFEVELEENIRRADLTWQEKATAIAQLSTLRRMQAGKEGLPLPTHTDLAPEAYPDVHPNTASENTRRDLILARNLKDPDVAKAKSPEEAFKLLKRKEETRRNVELGEAMSKTFSARDHTLVLADCLSHMEYLLSANHALFDCICTDPPYGIDAQDFNDSGGRVTGSHLYDDSLANWQRLMGLTSVLLYRITRLNAHAYLFCDIDNFVQLKFYMSQAGWNVFRTPLVWVNPTSVRAPWPEHGPQRKYQLILYARKGEKKVTRLYGDVLTYSQDPNLGWAAQKPVELIRDLLRRSCNPGDTVLDPFAGSGSIFPAAHSLRIRAMGIEQNAGAYAIAAKRIQELK
jgi:ParB/RepB/Spo0J family partition protein